MKEGIIVLGHGSRRALANQEIKEITENLKENNPQGIYQVAFWEFGQPSLTEAMKTLIRDGLKKIIIVPLFLTVGNHIYQGIPQKISEFKNIYPEIEFVLAKHLGPDPRIIQIVEDRIKIAKEEGLSSLK